MGTIKLPNGFDGHYKDPSDPFGGYGRYNNKTDNWTLAVQDAATVEKLGDPFGAGLVEQITKLAQQNDKLAQQAAADNQRAAQSSLNNYTKAVEAETKLYAEKNRATEAAASKMLADTIARAERQAAEAQKRAERKAEQDAKKKAEALEKAANAKTLGDIPQEMRDQILKDFDKSGAKGSDWDLAPYRIKSERYEKYRADTLAAVKQAFPNIKDEDVEAYLDTINNGKEPIKPERGFMGGVTDAWNAFAGGAQSAGAGLLDLVGVDRENNFLADWAKETNHIENNSNAFDWSGVEKDQRLDDAWREREFLAQNPTASQAELETFRAQDTIKDLGITDIANLAGGFVPDLVAAAAAYGVTAMSGGAAAPTAVATTANVANRLRQGAKYIPVAMGMLNSMGDASLGASDNIMDLSDEEFRSLPNYQKFLQEAGGDEQRARYLMADAASNAALNPTTAGGLTNLATASLGSVLPGSAERYVGEMATGALGKTDNLLSAAGKMLGSSALGAVEEGGTQLASNLATQTQNENHKTWDGVGANAALGFVADGTISGVGNTRELLAGYSENRQAAATRSQDADVANSQAAADAQNDGANTDAASEADAEIIAAVMGGATDVTDTESGMEGDVPNNDVFATATSADSGTTTASTDNGTTTATADSGTTTATTDSGTTTASTDSGTASADSGTTTASTDSGTTTASTDNGTTTASTDNGTTTASTDNGATTASTDNGATTPAQPRKPSPAERAKMAEVYLTKRMAELSNNSTDQLAAMAYARELVSNNIVNKNSKAYKAMEQYASDNNLSLDDVSGLISSDVYDYLVDNDTEASTIAPNLLQVVKDFGVTSKENSMDGDKAADMLAAEDPLTFIADKRNGFGTIMSNMAASLKKAFTITGTKIPKAIPFNQYDGHQKSRIDPNANGTYVYNAYDTGNLDDSVVVLKDSRFAPSTILHEYMHALTFDGLTYIEFLDKRGDEKAKAYISIANKITDFLREKAANNPDNAYVGFNPADKSKRHHYGSTNIHEAFSEMINPSFMGFAAQYSVKDLDLTLEEQTMLAIMYSINGKHSLFTAIKKLVKYAIVAGQRFLNNTGRDGAGLNGFSNSNANTEIDDVVDTYFSLPNVLALMASEAALSRKAAKAAGMNYNGNVRRLGNDTMPTQPQQEVGIKFEQGLNDAQTNPTTQSVLSNITHYDGSETSDATQSAGDVLNAIQSGRNAIGVSLSSDLATAARNRDADLAKSVIQKATSNIAEMFHDSMTPVYDWLNRIEDGVFANSKGETIVSKLKGALQRAPGIRDAHLNRLHEKHGGKQMFAIVSKLAMKHKMSEETAWLMAGRWLTARYAPQANQHLILRMSEDIAAFETFRAQRQAEINNNPDNRSQTDLTKMQNALNAAIRANQRQQKRLTALIAAVAEPTIQSGKAKVPMAAGMNDATARAMQAALEQRFKGSEADLLALADAVKEINSYRLALDIESGKASPTIVAKFLRQSNNTELLKAMRDLKAAADVGNRGDAVADAQLDALRKRVADMVKTDYVPLSGHDQSAAEQELFAHSRLNGEFNVNKYYRLDGVYHMPNDGLTTTMAGLIGSATYAGYREFGDNLSKMYSQMTDAQRDRFGLHALDITKSKIDVPMNSVVVRRDGRAIAFRIANAKVFDALRKTNIDQTSRLMQAFQYPTRTFGYFATQANPLFSLKQLVRDTFEKADVLASKEVYDENGVKLDSGKLAGQVRAKMLVALVNPLAYNGIIRSAMRFAFGRPNKYGVNVHEAGLRELRDAGALSTYNSQYKANAQSVVDMIKKHRDTKMNKMWNAVADFIEAYNNTSEYAVSLAVHEVLRENGVDNKQATSIGLDLMNFRKKGTATPFLSVFYAFAQPSLTGGANLINTLYDTRRGTVKKSGMVTLGYYIVILTILQSIAAALGGDDEGGDKIDQAGEWKLNSSLPIPLPSTNTTFNIPLGFGLQRIANAVARSARGVYNGDQTTGDLFHNVAVEGMVSGVSPIHPSNIDWRKRPYEAFLATFAPTLWQPIVAVGTNRSAFDAPIVDRRHAADDLYEWEQYGRNTAPVWKAIAKSVFNATNIDIAPEEARAIIRGYMPGVLGMAITETVENPYRRANGDESTYVGSTISPFSSLTPEAAIRGQFYKWDERINDIRKEMRLNPSKFPRGSVERKLIAIQDQWNEEESSFASRQRENNKIKNETLRHKANMELRRDKTDAHRRYVYLYRKAKGLHTVETK